MAHISSVRRAARSGRIVLLVCALACTFALASAAQATGATFDPAKVISDDNFRAYDSMTQTDIQAFLKTQPGVLATYQATDYSTGKKALASQIIANACAHFRISPKVVLTMLQKEQSLLTRSKSSLVTGKHPTLDWALGMGCPDGYSSCKKSGCHTKTPPDNRYPEYRGFGKQLWAAAWSLDAYGEKGKTRPGWHHAAGPHTESADWKVGTVFKGLYAPGGSKDLAIQNLASFKLYTYNPSIGAKKPYGDLSSQSKNLSGNANFWMIYRKYFGDTFANPAIRPVYRFRDTKLGTYLYTASPAERYNLTKVSRFKSEGVKFSWDTSNTANSIPVYRFMNRKSGGYLFTASAAFYTTLTTNAAKKKAWKYNGVAFLVSGNVAGAKPVYQFNNKKNGLTFLTTSTSEKKKFAGSTYRKKWAYKGVPYYIAP